MVLTPTRYFSNFDPFYAERGMKRKPWETMKPQKQMAELFSPPGCAVQGSLLLSMQNSVKIDVREVQ